MAGVRIDVFKGIRPRVARRLLQPGEATTAHNIQFGSGHLEPWNSLSQVGNFIGTRPRTLHLMRNNGSPKWLCWNGVVDVVRGPVADDALERTYYTGEGLSEPRMTHTGLVGDPADGVLPIDYRRLGIPAPTTPPAVTGDELPDNVVVGTVTAFETPSLKADFTIDQGLPHEVNSWYMALTEGGGTPSDNGYEPAGTSRTFRFHFPVGHELRVASVLDENTITVEDANAGDYVAAGIDDTRSGQTWWRTEDTGTTRAGFFRFYLPNGIKLTISDHGLQEGDVIRVTAVQSPISITFTAPQNITESGGHFFGWESDNTGGSEATNTWPAAPTAVGADSFYRAGSRSYPFVDIWASSDATSSFEVSGQFSYQLIERGGVSYVDILSNIESRLYVYTFVSDLGEEGPPSPASDIVTIPSDGAVTVGSFEAPPVEKQNITHIRIYRANTGSVSTEFQFVDEIASPFNDYTDEVAGTDLGEVLQTESWEPPPENLRGLVSLPNGVLAGFVGKTVYFCEPYFPHAWPPEYKVSVDHEIVGLGVLPNGVAVLTRGPAYLLAGDHPRSMSARQVAASQSCVSKRSIVSTIDSVIYASPDGLASIGAGGFRLLTESYARKKDWESFDPSNLQAFWHDDLYFGFNLNDGFVFDPRDPSRGWSTLGIKLWCGFVDTENDELYLVPEPELIPILLLAQGQSSHRGIVRSEDGGNTFTVVHSDNSNVYRELAHSPESGIFVCRLSSPDGTTIYSSTPFRISSDTETWVANTALDTANRSSAVYWSSLFGRFLAISNRLENPPLYSTNGDEWEEGEYDSSVGSVGPITAIADVPHLGFTIAISTWVMKTTDGVTWERIITNTAISSARSLAYSREQERLVATTSSAIYTSTDGTNWTNVGVNPGGAQPQAAWSPELGLWVVVGGTNCALSTSEDGINWTSHGNLLQNFMPYSMIWSSRYGKFFVVGGGTRYLSSEDGVNWNTHSISGMGNSWRDLIEGEFYSEVPIYKWNRGDDVLGEISWRSGDLVMPYPLNLAAGRVLADDYPVTFKLYDKAGTLRATRTVNDDGVFRLPGGYVTDTVSVEVSGTSVVRLIHVAETVEELYQG